MSYRLSDKTERIIKLLDIIIPLIVLPFIIIEFVMPNIISKIVIGIGMSYLIDRLLFFKEN